MKEVEEKNPKFHRLRAQYSVDSIACGFDFFSDFWETNGLARPHDATKPFPETHLSSSVLLDT